MLRSQPKPDEYGCLPEWMMDRPVNMPSHPINLRKPSRKLLDGSGKMEKAVRMTQEGTVAFGRKKKNGCKLSSGSTIHQGGNLTCRKHKILGCAAVFPKIKLDSSDLTV